MAYRGLWRKGTFYKKGDVVVHGGTGFSVASGEDFMLHIRKIKKDKFVGEVSYQKYGQPKFFYGSTEREVISNALLRGYRFTDVELPEDSEDSLKDFNFGQYDD